MANITVRGIEALRATDKEYKVTVDRGLYLRFAIDGVKTWHVRYVGGGGFKRSVWLRAMRNKRQPCGRSQVGATALSGSTACSRIQSMKFVTSLRCTWR